MLRVFVVPDTYLDEFYDNARQLEKAGEWSVEDGEAIEVAIERIEAMNNMSVQIGLTGTVMAFAGSLPDWVLACDGGSYQRVDYPTLYAVIDDSFKTGPDSFVVPDLRSRQVVGAGQGSGLDEYEVGDIGGTELPQPDEGTAIVPTLAAIIAAFLLGPEAVLPIVFGETLEEGAIEVVEVITDVALSEPLVDPYVALNFGIVAV